MVALLILAAGALANSAPDESLEAAVRGLDTAGTPAGADAPAPDTSHDRPVTYDGRPPAPRRLSSLLLTVPRAALFPVHAVLEYGVRRPMFAGLTALETHHVPARVERLFTSDDGKIGAFPVFKLDVGLRPRLGVAGFAKDIAGTPVQLAVGANAARPGVWRASSTLRAPILPADDGELRLVADYDTRDDAVFYGTGPDTRNDDRRYYRRAHLDTSVLADAALGGSSRFGTGLRLRRARFGESTFRRDDTNPNLPPPPTAGYELLSGFARLVLDGRERLGNESLGTGLHLELAGGLSAVLAERGARFGTWGGDLAGFLDVTGHGHLLAARVSAYVLDHFGGAEVPFFELLGVEKHAAMRGFLGGRLRGESAFVFELDYRYPIWSFVDAELFAGAGNVFDDRFSGFAPERLFGSWGLSLRANDATTSHFAATLAFGTTRFDDDRFSAADVVRVSIGFHQGF